MRNKKALRKLIPQIVDFFCLGPVAKIRKAGGDANANFIVATDRGRFFVKITLEPHTRDNKLLGAAYVAHLKVQGIPVVPGLPGNDGTTICIVDGMMATAQRVVVGSNPNITLATVSQIGEVLGRMHLVPTASLPQRVVGWLSPEYVANNLLRIRRDFCDNPDAIRILSAYDSCEEFTRDVVPKLPRSIIHGDLHSYNVLFSNGQLTAVVDYSPVAYGLCVFGGILVL